MALKDNSYFIFFEKFKAEINKHFPFENILFFTV